MEAGSSEELKERQRYWQKHLRTASALPLRIRAYS